MPILDRKSPLVPANMRASDVAHKMTEHIIPMQQQRLMAAFRVQGIPGILYSRLSSGMKCTCKSKNNEVARLSPDGKMPLGAINRALTGNENFGISDYTPEYPIDDPDLGGLQDAVTEGNESFRWSNADDNNVVGLNQIETEPTLGDNGQFSPDLDSMLAGFDLSTLGFSDISCPICFGSGFVGGYQAFRGFRKILTPSDMTTASFLMLPKITLSPGTHTCTVVLPKGVRTLDVFRTLNEKKVTVSKFYIDNEDSTNRGMLRYFDGKPHALTVVTAEPLTHLEIQASTSDESMYFEFPKRIKSQDIALLEQTEPFQIIVSPDVPNLQALDVIAESQQGKLLIVQSVNSWNTRNRQMLGFECQVRVAQPQELFQLLPFRRHITGQKAVLPASPIKKFSTSGFV